MSKTRTGILHPLATENPIIPFVLSKSLGNRRNEGDLHRTGRSESESLEKTFTNCRYIIKYIGSILRNIFFQNVFLRDEKSSLQSNKIGAYHDTATE